MQTSDPFPPTFRGNVISRSLCTLVKRFLVNCGLHLHRTPGLSRMCEIDLVLQNPLVSPDSCPTSAKWPVNKTFTPRSVCHIVHRTALSPTENHPDKSNMGKRKAMTALSHSTLPLTQHKHQSLPTGSGSERPLGCNLSQDRRR